VFSARAKALSGNARGSQSGKRYEGFSGLVKPENRPGKTEGFNPKGSLYNQKP